MASERDVFELSGPLHLTNVDWTNVDHRRSVAACLVQGVYIIQRDRQENRRGSEALAPPWWKFFHFDLQSQLIDDVDSSVFGAIYKFKPLSLSLATPETPSYVIAFRGTVTKGDAFSRDLQLDLHFVQNVLHQSSRFETAMQAVRNLVAATGSQRSKSNVWLTGHSLGAAMAMLTGKNMVRSGILLESHLFNPPFVSAPIEKIKHKKVKHGLRIASSFVTAGLAVAVKIKNDNHRQQNEGSSSFLDLRAWVPCLYVNPGDHICSEYVGYFDHRRKMEEIGAGGVERLAMQHSLAGLFMNAIGKEAHEPLHLLPSANLTVNSTRAPDLKTAHGIHQWWRCDQKLNSRVYR